MKYYRRTESMKNEWSMPESIGIGPLENRFDYDIGSVRPVKSYFETVDADTGILRGCWERLVE